MNKAEYQRRHQDAENKRLEASENAYRKETIGALKAIAEQNRAAEAQAKRADRFHRRVEKLTLRLEGRKFWIEIAETAGLWFAAAVGVVAIVVATRDAGEQRGVMQGQLTEMRQSADQTRQMVEAAAKQADAAQKQAAVLAESVKTARDNFSASERPWIGPLTAQSSAPSLGQDLKITVPYQNTGREPALQAVGDLDVFTFEENNGQAGVAARDRIERFIGACKIAWNPTAVQVVFPTAGGLGGNTYNISKNLPGAEIDQQVIDGKKSIIIDGCFVYQTSQKVSHFSSFCFFYTAKVTDSSHWNICRAGNDAN